MYSPNEKCADKQAGKYLLRSGWGQNHSRQLRRLLALGAVAALGTAGLAGCGSAAKDTTPKPAESKEVTLVTHNDFHIPDEAVQAFEKSSGLKVKFVQADSGEKLVSKLALTKKNPIGDAVYGIATNDMGRVGKEKLLATTDLKAPAGAEKLVDPQVPAALPIDHGDVCVNIDTVYFEKARIAAPATFEDLVKPEYRGLMVTMKAGKVTGFAFLAATIAHFGADGWPGYWEKLKANNLKVVDGWSEAYNQEFTAGEGKGKYPIVVSYASSPAYTVSEDKKTSTTKALAETCYQQVEYAGVLENAKNPTGAAQVIAWLQSPEVQKTIPENMYMYPADPAIPVPVEFEKFAPLPEKSALLPSAEVVAQHDAWVRKWTEIMGG